MSERHNQEFASWQKQQLRLMHADLRVDGVQLSLADKFRIALTYVLWANVLRDLYGSVYPREFSIAALSSWLVRCSELDTSDVLSEVKGLKLCLANYSPYMGESGWDSFKHYLLLNDLRMDSVVLSQFVRPVKEFVSSYTGFKDLNTALVFIERLTLHDVHWIEDAAKEDYISFEIGLRSQVYDPALLRSLKEVVNEHYSDIEFVPIFDHGPGATSEIRRGSGIAPKVKYVRNNMTFATRQLLEMGEEPIELADDMYCHPDMLQSTVQFVPKGINKKRTICMENTLHQYAQSAISRSFERHFCRKPQLRIDLHDQSLNRDLARKGSIDSTYGTIDLSNASDSVTLTLFDSIFSDTPVYHWVHRCRTRSAVIDNQVIALEKLAPMGSKICFPIECAIFSAIILLAQKRVGVNSYFRVYGDDMVVHHSCFDEVVCLLKALHFDVNDEKSFPPGSAFTESCGGEYYLGQDVSPCRVPRFFDPFVLTKFSVKNSKVTWKGNVSSVQGVIALCNRLNEFHLRGARRYLLRTLLRVCPCLPFSHSGKKGIQSDDVNNYHLKRRWNSDLQRSEYHALFIHNSTDTSPIDYELTLYAMALRPNEQIRWPDQAIRIRGGQARTSARMHWFSEWDLIDVPLDKEYDTLLWEII